MNIFIILERKLVEPVLHKLKPLFSSEISYYKVIMKSRALLRGFYSKSVTSNTESSEITGKYYLQKVNKTDRILEYGCGVCGLGSYFIKHLEMGLYTGCDISADAIKQAKSTIAKLALAEKKPSLVLFNNLSELNTLSHGQVFNKIICNSVFTHTSNEVVESCLNYFKEITNKDSVIYADFAISNNGKCYDRCGIDYIYSKEFISDLLDTMELSYQIENDWPGPKNYDYSNVLYRMEKQ